MIRTSLFCLATLMIAVTQPALGQFSGRVTGERMAGQAALSGSRIAARVEWTAERAARTAAMVPVTAERKMVY